MKATLRQSVGYVELFSSLGAAAIMTWIVWRLAETPQSRIGDKAQLESVRRSHQWTELLLNNLPIIFLLIAVVGSIAFTVYQTRYA